MEMVVIIANNEHDLNEMMVELPSGVWLYALDEEESLTRDSLIMPLKFYVVHQKDVLCKYEHKVVRL